MIPERSPAIPSENTSLKELGSGCGVGERVIFCCAWVTCVRFLQEDQSWKTEVGRLKLEVGSQKSGVGRPKSEVGGQKSEVGRLMLEVGRLKS